MITLQCQCNADFLQKPAAWRPHQTDLWYAQFKEKNTTSIKLVGIMDTTEFNERKGERSVFGFMALHHSVQLCTVDYNQ